MQPLLVLAAALLILGLLAVVSAVPPSDDNDPSSRSAGKLGTLALYTWLERLGLPVSRVSDTFSTSGADVVVEYDPTIEFDVHELDAITTFVRGGGDLLLVLDAETIRTAAPLLQRLQVQVDTTVSPGNATPAQPFDPAGKVRSVPVGPGLALFEQPPAVPLLRENGQVVAAATTLGQGRAFVLADSAPLSNDGLRHDDSAYFVLSLLELARGGHIAFGVVHHGEGGGAGGADAIFGGPIGLGTALAALLLIVAFALNGRRLGRPAPAEGAAAPSATTYVNALGDLFARSRRRGMVAGRYADELKRRIGAVSGVAWQLDDDAFVSALAAADQPRAGETAALLARARRLESAAPDERALLRLARDVAAAEEAWPTPAQWRP
ncbi:MAG: DUF4350 domain-containing protein [Candidatus Dormibacteria bacterium]